MATSLQEYLKKYQSTGDESKKLKSKAKKRKGTKSSKAATGVIIVDSDAGWQKTINEDSDPELEEGDVDGPQVIEDVEVKRMHQMERLQQHRPYMSVGDDGSGWVTVADSGKDSSPPRRQRRNDYVEEDDAAGDQGAGDLRSKNISPPRRHSRCPDLSPKRARDTDLSPPSLLGGSPDLSPPRRKGAGAPSGGIGFGVSTLRQDSGSSDLSPPRRNDRSTDLSPPRRGARSVDLSPSQKSHSGTQSGFDFRRKPPRPDDSSRKKGAEQRSESNAFPRSRRKVATGDLDTDSNGVRKKQPRLDSPDMSPPKRKQGRLDSPDMSPPRRKRVQSDSPDISPPRRRPPQPETNALKEKQPRSDSPDMSPPRMKQPRSDSPDLSSPRRKLPSSESDANLIAMRKRVKMTDGRQAGLTSDKDLAEELAKKKLFEAKRMKEMDPSVSGRHAETVYRDKRGKRLEGLEELLRQQQGDVKPQAKPLEWGKGLAQKREQEVKQAEFDEEKIKPFARSRDDPELDNLLKDRLRWGDPMAHLVKQKNPEAMLVDLGATDEMKESGFIVPQDVPKHSWLKRGMGAPPNRYGIKPGRHWDGVDRSSGFEKEMFKAKAEKQATEMEAYMWSVADM